MKFVNCVLIFLVLTMSDFCWSLEYKKELNTCFPISTLNYVAGVKSLSGGLREDEFNQIIKLAIDTMGPEVKRLLNKKLIIEGRWQDASVDAFATRDDDNNAVVVMNGGLARHPDLTIDGFLVLICHEIGHHLGGAPKNLRGNSGLRSWSSAEGQADYYATSKCLPVFQRQGNLVTSIPNASLSVSKVFASLVIGTPEPKLTDYDTTKVSTTFYKHPSPQCRLDTYLAGANCEIGADVPFDPVNPLVGACVRDKGIRPSCWFQENDF
ncbi:MAG: hypothetical protein K2Q18_17195 [Bdellovibrionales bacterium]|nr:hypothetical protein [Bdellovibrionales bacterium]